MAANDCFPFVWSIERRTKSSGMFRFGGEIVYTNICSQNLQSFKQDVLREVGRMVARNRQDMVEQEERFTMQQSTHLALIQEATTESLSLIKAQRLETQGQIPASLGRQSRIPSELKAENIRPTPLSSRQSSAQTTKYYGGGYPNPAAAPISNPAVSRNISAYSSQQQSLRGVPAILHDLLPQSPPHKDIKQNMNLPSDSNGMVSIPAMELQRLLNNAQLLTALADTVHELSIKDANKQQNQGTGPETEYRTTQDMELTTLRVSDGVHVHHQQMKRQWSYPPIQAEMGNERGAWHWF